MQDFDEVPHAVEVATEFLRRRWEPDKLKGVLDEVGCSVEAGDVYVTLNTYMGLIETAIHDGNKNPRAWDFGVHASTDEAVAWAIARIVENELLEMFHAERDDGQGELP